MINYGSVYKLWVESLFFAYLLVTDGKLALGLLVVLGKGLKGLDGRIREDRHGEPDIGLGVLMTGLQRRSVLARICRVGFGTYENLGVVGQATQRHV